MIDSRELCRIAVKSAAVSAFARSDICEWMS